MEREHENRDEHLIDLGAISVETKGSGGGPDIDALTGQRYVAPMLSEA